VKNNLKKITDKTIQELLHNEIILPSSYFKSFDQNAKGMSIEINDSQFESEVSTILVDELRDINSYMKKTVKNIDSLTDATVQAQQAIKEKDDAKLNSLGFALAVMKKDMQALKELIYLDPATKTFNKKWIYNHAINENGAFDEKGILLLIDIADCDYLAEKYGNLIVDNVILYIASFLTKKFQKENIKFEIARYSNAQFVLFIKQDTPENISSFLLNTRVELSNTTLKSKSGLMFKANFNFGLVKYAGNEDFHSTLEKAYSLAIEEKAIS
tara:strand:- start:14411 stop:15223 length:813 start_codon:yes stop_codon:yes gene_type:complete